MWPLRMTAALLLMLCGMFASCADRYGMRVVSSERRDGYECRHIEFSAGGEERIRAYLLVPDSSCLRKLPAVLMLHDHGARFDIGKEKLVRPAADAPVRIRNSSRQWVEKYFDGVYFGDRLASEGYVVLVADALYWGERSSPDACRWSELSYGDGQDPGSLRYGMPEERLEAEKKRLKEAVYEGQRDVYDSLAAGGIVWARKILEEDIACAGLLRSLPYVDGNRIGAFGFSMGAHRCWLLSAFCRDVSCGAAVCWMTLKKNYDSSSASDLSMRIPSMRDTLDFPDIASFLAPKPMLFLCGDKDSLFPAGDAGEAFSKMHAIYDGIQSQEPAGQALETAFFDGGHHCGKKVQAAVADFFARRLQPGE